MLQFATYILTYIISRFISWMPESTRYEIAPEIKSSHVKRNICDGMWRDGFTNNMHSGKLHYSDVIMSAMTSQITNISIVCSTVGSNTNQRKPQSPALLAFVWGIHRWPVNSLDKEPVTRNILPFDDVIKIKVRQMICSFVLALLWD